MDGAIFMEKSEVRNQKSAVFTPDVVAARGRHAYGTFSAKTVSDF
jgi:hypothetical protein